MSRVVSAPTAPTASQMKVPQEKISMRAYEKWCKRGRPNGTHLQDWLEAERRVMLKPPVRVSRLGDWIEVSVDLTGVASASIEIVVAGEMVLIHSLGGFPVPMIFRTVILPAAIDARTTNACLRGCALIFTADLVCNK